MKTTRQEKIIEIIKKYEVETQDDLIAYLGREGFNVTQATVSRDIKQLGLIKAQDKNGRYRYVTSRTDGSSETNYLILISSIINIEYALNNVVIKCHTGMAQAVCAKLDAMNIKGILGTIAGEDTILIITRSEADSASLCDELHNIIKR